MAALSLVLAMSREEYEPGGPTVHRSPELSRELEASFSLTSDEFSSSAAELCRSKLVRHHAGSAAVIDPA